METWRSERGKEWGERGGKEWGEEGEGKEWGEEGVHKGIIHDNQNAVDNQYTVQLQVRELWFV